MTADAPAPVRERRSAVRMLGYAVVSAPQGGVNGRELTAQAELIGELLLGRYALPHPEAMRAEIERERARARRRFVASPRHTMEIDFDNYLQALARERRAGERRARRAA